MDQIQPSKPVKSFDQIWIKEFSTKKKLDQNQTLVGNNKQNCNYIACGSQIIKRPNAADPNEHDILYTHTHTRAQTHVCNPFPHTTSLSAYLIETIRHGNDTKTKQ